jgi:hypothetical protein
MPHSVSQRSSLCPEPPPTPPPRPTHTGEAGSVWRSERLRDFHWRLRCLGLDQDEGACALLAQIAEQSSELEELAVAQQAPGYERPWWQTGEYDDRRADE